VDYEMIIIFSVMSIVFGGIFGLLYRSLLLGLFFVLLFLGLVVTTALSLVTKYDGVLVWIAGPLTTLVPFWAVLKFKYPDKWKQLNEVLKFRK